MAILSISRRSSVCQLFNFPNFFPPTPQRGSRSVPQPREVKLAQLKAGSWLWEIAKKKNLGNSSTNDLSKIDNKIPSEEKGRKVSDLRARNGGGKARELDGGLAASERVFEEEGCLMPRNAVFLFFFFFFLLRCPQECTPVAPTRHHQIGSETSFQSRFSSNLVCGFLTFVPPFFPAHPSSHDLNLRFAPTRAPVSPLLKGNKKKKKEKRPQS